MGTIYLLSPITVISLKAIDLNNRGWNVVTPSDRMLSIILAESEHLDNLGYTWQLMQASLRSFAQDLDNHEVLATEREPEGQAQRSNLGTAFGLHKIWLRYKVLACSEVVSLPVAEGVASLHPRLLKLSPPATILYALNKPISSTGDNRYIVPKSKNFVFHFVLRSTCSNVA